MSQHKSPNDMPDVDELERASRVYRTNKLASAALGIHLSTFSRLCEKHEIETPQQKREDKQKDDWSTFRRNTGIGRGPEHPFRRSTKG